MSLASMDVDVVVGGCESVEESEKRGGSSTTRPKTRRICATLRPNMQRWDCGL